MNNYLDEIEKIAQDLTVNQEPTTAKDKIISGAKRIGRGFVDGKANSFGQEATAFLGAAAGTALAKRKGMTLGNAAAKGGLAGMALADLGASAIIPSMQLKKRHKAEFGENPDAKDYAKVLAVNTLPTAALWGTMLGNKKIRGKVQNGLSKAPQNINRSIASMKGIGRDFKNTNKAMDAISSKVNPTQADLDAMKEISKKFSDKATKKVKRGAVYAGKALGSAGVIDVAGKLAEIPTYAVTPRNVVEDKKKRLQQQQLQQ